MAARHLPHVSPAAAVLHAIRNQIAAAIAVAGDARQPFPRRIHDARRHTKKARALVRLLRPQARGACASVNVRCRNAARRLSPLRDAEVVVGCCAGLVQQMSRAADRAALVRFRQQLCRHRQAALDDELALQALLREFVRDLRDAEADITALESACGGVTDLAAGLLRTFRQARVAMRRALDEPSDEHLHHWRKRVKDHGHQLHLLCASGPPALGERRPGVGRLAELLGNYNDLALLGRAWREHRQGDYASRQVDPIAELIRRQRADLRAEITSLGEALFSEGAADLLRQLHSWPHAA